MAYESRLLNRPRFQKIADEAQEIENDCSTIINALADYESADDLSGEEATEQRDDVRDEAIESVERVVAAAARMQAELDKIEEEA